MSKIQQLIGQNNRLIPPVTQDRALYNYFRGDYPANVILPMSYLRSDTLLTNTSEIRFNINETQGTANILPTERRLSLNNTFEVLYYSLNFYSVTTTAGVPNVKFQTRKLYTYINPFIFAGAGEADALESVYNSGKLIYKLDNQVLYPAIDCRRFMRIPTSQEGQITTVTDAGVVVGRVPRDGYTEYQYEFGEAIPTHTLNGNGQNSYTISLPEAVDMAPPAGQNRLNYCALIIHGFEGVAGTQQKNRKRGISKR